MNKVNAADEYSHNGNDRKALIDHVSSFFEKLGGWSYDHRWIVLITCILLLVACFFSAMRVRFDNSFEAYFDRDDQIYKDFLQFRDDFGSDEIS